MRLDEANGYYSPSFFNMVIETNEDTITAINNNTPTFTHEFVHYLQDLILPYNIRLNLTQLRWFTNIKKYAHKVGQIIRPFQNWDQESKTLQMQYFQTFGLNPREIAFVDQVSQINEVQLDYKEGSGFDAIYSMTNRNFKVYKYRMRVNDMSDFYSLGARDLLEYIAYKIEKKHFPAEANLPQLPYASLDLLFDYYGLSEVPEEIRLCIAEACLYNDNPIRFLFLNFLENTKFKQCTSTLTYEKVYKRLLNIEFQATDGIKETISHKTSRRLTQFEKDLTIHYANFTDIRKWIARVNAFVEQKMVNRFIFSDMFHMSNLDFSATMSDIIAEIGLPLLMNNRQECVSLQTQETDVNEFVQFYIFQNFLHDVMYDSNHVQCPVYDFCKANNSPFKDEYEECSSLFMPPSGRACFYSVFLESYGLRDIEIV